MKRGFTFVTIGFEDDAGLLRLQARSISLYCAPELVEEIIIVDNSASKSASWQRTLAPLFGPLSDKVRIIPAAGICSMPPETGGWFSQQILKIKVADVVRSDRYVLLDAKNHLISALDRTYIEAPNGLPRNYCRSYEGHVMLEYLERTLQYLGLNPDQHKQWFPRTHPPFTIYTAEAQSLVRQIEQTERKDFASVFIDKKFSEFYLYSGFLTLQGRLHTLYDMTQPYEPQIWPGDGHVKGCEKAISRATEEGCPFMTVHRGALQKLDEPGRNALAAFWHRRSLFASPKDAKRFLRDPNRCVQHSSGKVISWPWSALLR